MGVLGIRLEMGKTGCVLLMVGGKCMSLILTISIWG